MAMRGADRRRHHRAAWTEAASRRRPLSRDVSRCARGRQRTLALHRDLFPAGARRALALASHRRGGGLALLRRQRADLADRRRRRPAQHHGSAPISPPAKCRRRSCRRRPGRPPKAPATGRWSDAPSRRDSILRSSNWRRRAGSRQLTRHPELPKVASRNAYRFQIISLAAINPPPAISTAAIGDGGARPGKARQNQKRGREQRRRIGRSAQHADIAALHADIPGVERRPDRTDAER